MPQLPVSGTGSAASGAPEHLTVYPDVQDHIQNPSLVRFIDACVHLDFVHLALCIVHCALLHCALLHCAFAHFHFSSVNAKPKPHSHAKCCNFTTQHSVFGSATSSEKCGVWSGILRARHWRHQARQGSACGTTTASRNGEAVSAVRRYLGR